MTDFTGKVAVVLGASAQGGIGWTTAEALAAHGAKVVVGARSYAPLKGLADRIGGMAVRCDATDETDVAALAQAAVSAYGKVDIAVNSAGQPVMGPIADATPEKLLTGVRTNYFTHVYFIKHMARAIGSNGSIVIVSSICSTHPDGWFFAYGCGKAAADCLVRYAALEYGPKNIRVNSILPGPTLTDLTHEVHGDPAMNAANIRNIPLKRIGHASDMANAILWLAGPAYITGVNLDVNGGMHLLRMAFEDELPRGYATYGEGKVLFDKKETTDNR